MRRMFEEMFRFSASEDEGDFMPIFSVDENSDNEPTKTVKSPYNSPILALKNTVLFTGIITPITVGRDKSIKAINAAYNNDKYIAVFTQKDSQTEIPTFDDLYDIGTAAKIVKLIKMPDGTTTAILQGKKRLKLDNLSQEDPYLEGSVRDLNNTPAEDKLQFEAKISSIRDSAKRIIHLNPNIPSEANTMLENIDKDAYFLDFVSSNLGVNAKIKQQIIAIDNLGEKADFLLDHMGKELQLLELKGQIESKVKVDLEKQQRDYFLNQQLKTIQDELGNNPHEEEIIAIEKKGAKKKWPKAVKKTFYKELTRLKRTNPSTPDYSVLINYLDLLTELPWKKYSKDNFDLKRAHKVLDERHYGLDKVKDRIIEHLAVLKLKKNMKAPIICLVGPPGVGKTSLGKSVAEALDRKYIRMSFGGLHDESEIRGHRKTYIGAMPGRIIQSIKKAKTSNPVFILDEIDKIGKDFRGDPSSALLEVLDPEQNNAFHDNYLDLEYDLSKVLFIATANSLNTIQPALLDRMEIIEVSGYSIEEKIEIAKDHLIPEQRKDHGLKKNDVKLSKAIIQQIIEEHTRESGVRSLKRKMASVMRSVAKHVAMDEQFNKELTKKDIKKFLGTKRFSNEAYKEILPVGVAVGLAWTQVGGDILYIETSLSKGKGKLTLTGNLGDVMKESAATALSYIKSHCEAIGINPKAFEENDIHIHVPEGAIPKDGPSAGVTMLSALTSSFLDKPLKGFTAMTGEITLRGKVLPVGGIKEKVLAAKRAGIKNILLCKENEKNVNEINPKHIEGVTFKYVTDMKDVLKFML